MPKVTRLRGLDAGQLRRIWVGLDPVPVGSTNVRDVAFDETRHVLFVRFKSGSLYAYAVPAEVFIGLFGAGSKGGYVFDVLRGGDGRRGNRRLDLDRRYDYLQVE